MLKTCMYVLVIPPLIFVCVASSGGGVVIRINA